MGIKDKVVNALRNSFDAEYIRLEDDDGISGFVVSPSFTGKSPLDRQLMIDKALSNDSLTREEQRHVLMIAALTPEEYETVGVRVRVHRVKQLAGGAVEIILHGALPDANYVRTTLDKHGFKTTNPKPVADAVGLLMSLRAKGTPSLPLTRQKAVRMLKRDPYIEVAANA
jgi:stress-induced morphogen